MIIRKHKQDISQNGQQPNNNLTNTTQSHKIEKHEPFHNWSEFGLTLLILLKQNWKICWEHVHMKQYWNLIGHILRMFRYVTHHGGEISAWWFTPIFFRRWLTTEVKNLKRFFPLFAIRENTFDIYIGNANYREIYRNAMVTTRKFIHKYDVFITSMWLAILTFRIEYVIITSISSSSIICHNFI